MRAAIGALPAVSLIVEKNDYGYSFLRGLYDVLKISNNGLKQTKQKQAGGDRCYRSKGIPLIAEDIGKALSNGVE